jgi:hypothetical protein
MSLLEKQKMKREGIVAVIESFRSYNLLVSSFSLV